MVKRVESIGFIKKSEHDFNNWCDFFFTSIDDKERWGNCFGVACRKQCQQET